MGQYAKHLKNLRYEISPEDDNYTEELLQVAKSFRDFDESLDNFIIKRGFAGDIQDIEEKVISGGGYARRACFLFAERLYLHRKKYSKSYCRSS